MLVCTSLKMTWFVQSFVATKNCVTDLLKFPFLNNTVDCCGLLARLMMICKNIFSCWYNMKEV